MERWRGQLDAWAAPVLDPVTQRLVRAGVHPHALTIAGFLVTCGAGWAFATGALTLAGALVLLGGAFDLFDGRVARAGGQASVFGSFFDSTLDRLSEVVVFLGLLHFYLRPPPTRDALMLSAVLLALAGSLLVSYTRARAEGLGLDCKVGLMQRAERVLLLGGAALLFGRRWNGVVLDAVLLAMAVLTHATALQRMLWIHRHTRRPSQREEQR